MASYQLPIKHNNEFSYIFNSLDYDITSSSKSKVIDDEKVVIEKESIFCFAFNVLIAKVLKKFVIALEETIVPLLFRYRLSLNRIGLDLEDEVMS